MKEDIIPSKQKSTNAELQDRYDHIMLLLAKGLKRAQILVDPLVLSWRMGNSSIDKYLQHVKGEITSNAQQARTEHLGRGILNLEYLYQVTLEKITDVNGKPTEESLPATRLCLDIQKEKNRLLQLSKVYDPRTEAEVAEVIPDSVHKLLDDVKIVNAPTIGKDLDAEIGKTLMVGSS